MRAFEITVTQVDEQGGAFYRATAIEFPHLVTYGYTEQSARDKINEDIDALEVMSRNMGHSFPQPRSQS